jgi:ABC-type hemin transport system substrate-binding protein
VMLDSPARMKAVRDLREALAAQRRTRSPSPRVLFAVWTNPLFVAGRKTYADDLLSLTGATNVVPVEGWPQYSLESLVAQPPDVLVYPRGAVTPDAVEQLFRTAPELRRTTTAIGVDENRFTRPGPRVPLAAAELNAILDRWSMLRK